MSDPEIKPGDRPPRGPHTVLHPDGTRQEVYGGPGYRPLLTGRQRARVAWAYGWRWLLVLAALLAWRLT